MRADILVFPGFDELDAIGPFEVLRNARSLGAEIECRLVAINGNSEITASHGLVVRPAGKLGDGPRADVVIVPGGGWNNRASQGAWAEAKSGVIPAEVTRLHREGATIAAVCTGAMLVAAAGLMRGRPAITHHAAIEDLRGSGAEIIEARVVDDGDLVSAGGVTSGLDLALWLVERNSGAEVARKVGELMEYKRRGPMQRPDLDSRHSGRPRAGAAMKIGVLAIQGDYEAHAKVLERMGVDCTLIKMPEDLDGVTGLILPGGESTTHLKVLTEEGLLEAVREFAEQGGAFFGTCAGAILLARDVRNPAQASLGLLDMAVLRNGYGRQLASHVQFGESKLRKEPLEMVFIRAPIIESVGPDVDVLAQDEGHPVLVQQGRVMAATFHPELTSDNTLHEHFVKLCKNGH